MLLGVLVRVVRLERTVSWSQTRRDTNFAIPGYSFFCHDTMASDKNKDFSVCGHLCGQRRFCAVFGNRRKTRYRPCRKALRRFASSYPGYNHGTPKCRALPVELHPDIQFLPLYHGGGENQRFFCLWSFLWSKPLLCRFLQSGKIQQTPVSQGFAAFHLAMSRLAPRHTQSKRATNCATPRNYIIFCPLALLARLAVPEKILALFACSIFSTAARAPPRCIRHRRRSASHPKVQALPTAQPPRNI